MTLPSGTRAPQVQQRVNSAGQVIFYRRKVRAWQKSPFTLCLPYEIIQGTTVEGGDPFNSLGTPHTWADTISTVHTEIPFMQALANESYEKFRGRTYDTAGLGVDFVERRQSVDMITRSLGTLVKFTREVRSFKFPQAAKTLQMHFVPKGVSKRKSLGNNFLEYHFGWEPLIHDIYDAAAVIHNPLKSFTATRGVAKGDRSGSWNENAGSVTNSGKWRCSYVHAQGGTVRAIQSPYLHTLEQMGLINPASLLWEVVPFSFVVDWFVNVGDVLRSATDFAGMTLENTYQSLIVRTNEQGMVVLNPGFPNPNNMPPRIYSANGLYCNRVVGLYQPTFQVKRLKLPSVTRALTMCSLLAQGFKDPPRKQWKRWIPKNEQWRVPR